MEQGSDDRLPVERAFVVQFSTRADLAAERPEGRVEHVSSGACEHFRTLDQLMAFMARVLAHRESTDHRRNDGREI